MQNLIVLCHRCFAWIETHSDLCPECGVDVLLDCPDPDQGELATALGRAISVIGPIRVDRRALPSFGYLVGTSDGILFLPRLHRRLNGAWEGVTSQNLPAWWPFRGDCNSPRFLNWLRNPFGVSIHNAPVTESLPEAEIGSLAERLLDSPGSFFLDLRTIQSVSSRRRRVKIDRAPFRSVTLIDETEDGSLLVSVNSHVAHAAKEKLRPAL